MGDLIKLAPYRMPRLDLERPAVEVRSASAPLTPGQAADLADGIYWCHQHGTPALVAGVLVTETRQRAIRIQLGEHGPAGVIPRPVAMAWVEHLIKRAVAAKGAR